ncbi:hypothetical protein Hanom_Chr11g00969861 [Helianthus anomalus]
MKQKSKLYQKPTNLNPKPTSNNSKIVKIKARLNYIHTNGKQEDQKSQTTKGQSI